MRDFPKSTGRRLSAGWFFPLVLLALPNCILPAYEAGDPEFDPGPEPRSFAIMCDIPKPLPEGEDDCAVDSEVDAGMPLARAAVALNLGDWRTLALDYSPEATSACAGKPKKIKFHGPFPDGYTVCLNCAEQIPSVYPDRTAACIAQCRALLEEGPTPPEGIEAFCNTNARVSTNFDETLCFEDACTDAGTPDPNFVDPRRDPEELNWVDFVNTSAVGNTLSFPVDMGPGTGDFSAGAASEQLITKGDAWVEFEAGELGVSHVIGVRTSCKKIADCPDTDGTLADIPLVLSLNVTGEVNVVENGAVLAGPFPNYNLGERFRIHVTDHNDGTADISFFRYTTPCEPKMPCDDPPFYVYTGAARPSYPLRVDATFREPNASLKNVTIMRIIVAPGAD